MDMDTVFQPGDIEKIREHYGEAFLQKVLRDIDIYSVKWELSDLAFVSYFSVNCIFTGLSKQYGNIVLKIGKPDKEALTERQALIDYSGRRFCLLYEDDIENGMRLLERIVPGTQLRDEKSLDKRLDIFCSVYDGLHISAPDPGKYPTYLNWVTRITDYMSKQIGCAELYDHMKLAEDICIGLTGRYTKSLLLHGDLHHDNILLDSDGCYRLIDPKGVIGDPVFDIGRFILNEAYEEAPNPEAAALAVVKGLSCRLGIPEIVITQGFFIEAAMSECWSVEEGLPPEEYPKRLGNVVFVRNLLDKLRAAL